MLGRPRRSLAAPLVVLAMLVSAAWVAGPPAPFRSAGLAGGGSASAFAIGASLRGSAGPPSQNGAALDCSILLSNASLNASVNAAYASLIQEEAGSSGGPNASAPWNHTPLVPLSSLPTESAAVGIVIGWWTTVCRSSEFLSLYEAWGAANFTWTNGVSWEGVDWSFGIIWSAQCDVPGYGISDGCGFEESWTGNLVTLRLAGPTGTVTLPCADSPCPSFSINATVRPPGPGSSGGSGPFGALSALPFVDRLGIALLAALGAAGIGVLAVRRNGRRPVDEEESSRSEPARPGEPLDEAV